MTENMLILDRHLLVCVQVDVKEQDAAEYEYLKSHFCGRVQIIKNKNPSTLNLSPPPPNGNLYLCGNMYSIRDEIEKAGSSFHVIKELSTGSEGIRGLTYATLGEVPINIRDVALYYRDCLSIDAANKNYFDLLQSKHTFQALTESNKPNKAFRKGIYLSEVNNDNHNDTAEFHLLRCSANLSGPTLAFADEDREILAKVNDLAQQNFEQNTELNHVLAQVYENSVTVNEANKPKEHKAKIKDHSDKTKDMPANGLIAFCTFYSSDIDTKTYKSKPHDRFNRYFKDASVLTQLRFRLKSDASQLFQASDLTPDFRVTLYPNSVLLIPLSTNRLYTHEIVPPTLPVGRFPTRLGYVVRCSQTKAVFKDGATFLQRGGKEMKLVEPKEGEVYELKGLYQQENISVDRVVYRDFDFSLNEGDYLRPVVEQLN